VPNKALIFWRSKHGFQKTGVAHALSLKFILDCQCKFREQYYCSSYLLKLFEMLNANAMQQPKESVAVTSLFSPRDGTWQSKDSCITVSLSMIGLRLRTTAKPFLFSGTF